MNEQDEALKELLRRAAPGPPDRELKRDLWPEIRQRIEGSPVQIPWRDLAFVAMFLLCLLLFPETIPTVLYLL